MGPSSWPALPVSAACLAGVLLAGSGAARTIPGAVVLLGLGLCLDGRLRSLTSGVALGLIGGWSDVPERGPGPEVPVVLIAHLEGHWSTSPEGAAAVVRGEWLRVGEQVWAWDGRAVISLPLGMVQPASRRLRARGYLRKPVPLANGVRMAPSGWHLYIKSPHFIEALAEKGPLAWFHHLSVVLRGRIQSALEHDEVEGSPGATLIRALVLGDSWSVPGSWKRSLQACGLSHLLALSGLHVGLLAGIVLLLTFRLGIGARAMMLMTLALGYLMFVGPRPSLIRACSMLVAAWVAPWWRRCPVPGNALVAVAGAMVTTEPRLVGDIGFRLTVSATAGIIVLSPILERRWTRLPAWLGQSLSITVGAQLATLTWALPIFHLLTPMAPIWNLVAVPWTGVALAIGALWGLVALASPDLAAAMGFLVDSAAAPFRAVATLPPTVTRPHVVDLGYLQSLSLAVVALGALSGRKVIRFVCVGIATVSLVNGLIPVPGRTELTLLDVGQGESILVRDGRSAVLLDGGGWRRGDIGSRVLLPVLASQGVKRLDALILSHPDLDHCGGLVQIASFLPVGEVWSSSGWSAGGCVSDLYGLPKVKIRTAWAGDQMQVGAWNLQVLNPPPGSRRGINDRSLVLMATLGDHTFLLTGDIETVAERRLVRAYPEALQGVDILKVAHHGSRTSSSAEFLDHLQPSLALVSAGVGNRYGHPAPQVMERLRARGALALRTDEQGIVRLEIDRSGALRIHLPGIPRPLE